MTHHPRTLSVGARVGEALELLQRHNISEIPIIDSAGRPVGLLDVTDVIGISATQQEAGNDPVIKRTA